MCLEHVFGAYVTLCNFAGLFSYYYFYICQEKICFSRLCLPVGLSVCLSVCLVTGYLIKLLTTTTTTTTSSTITLG